MTIDELKLESEKKFKEFVDMYVDAFAGRFPEGYVRGQFEWFNDPAGRFIYPYLFDIYSFPARRFPDDEDGQSLEDWQLEIIKSHTKEKTSEMVHSFADYMWHILVIKVILTVLEISDE
jgi:hypothetical protein